MEISNKQKVVALLKSIETGVIITLMIVAGFAACTAGSADSSTQQQNDEAAIKTLLENYKASINQADTTLAKTFWLTTGQASFIHPRGHEKGWENIKKGIYEMFGSRFAQRDLKSFDETITQYGDMAVLEFYWIFDATFADGAPIQTKGRETQVLKKTGGEWRLVHVHYSGMPATGEREGF